MPYNDIFYHKRDAVATITLNRPQVMNACTIKTYDEMLDALRDAEADDSVRVVVLTGAGRGFCAGDDVKEIFLNPEFRDAKPVRLLGLAARPPGQVVAHHVNSQGDKHQTHGDHQTPIMVRMFPVRTMEAMRNTVAIWTFVPGVVVLCLIH